MSAATTTPRVLLRSHPGRFDVTLVGEDHRLVEALEAELRLHLRDRPPGTEVPLALYVDTRPFGGVDSAPGLKRELTAKLKSISKRLAKDGLAVPGAKPTFVFDHAPLVGEPLPRTTPAAEALLETTQRRALYRLAAATFGKFQGSPQPTNMVPVLGLLAQPGALTAADLPARVQAVFDSESRLRDCPLRPVVASWGEASARRSPFEAAAELAEATTLGGRAEEERLQARDRALHEDGFSPVPVESRLTTSRPLGTLTFGLFQQVYARIHGLAAAEDAEHGKVLAKFQKKLDAGARDPGNTTFAATLALGNLEDALWKRRAHQTRAFRLACEARTVLAPLVISAVQLLTIQTNNPRALTEASWREVSAVAGWVLADLSVFVGHTLGETAHGRPVTLPVWLEGLERYAPAPVPVPRLGEATREAWRTRLETLLARPEGTRVLFGELDRLRREINPLLAGDGPLRATAAELEQTTFRWLLGAAAECRKRPVDVLGAAKDGTLSSDRPLVEAFTAKFGA